MHNGEILAVNLNSGDFSVETIRTEPAE